MLLRLTDKTSILRSYLRLRREIKVSTVFLQFQGNDVVGLELCWNRLYIILIYKFCSWFVSFVICLKRKRSCIRKVILNYVNYFILNNLIRFINALNLPKEWIVLLRPFTFPKYGARKIVVIKSSTRVSDNCLICCSHEIAGSRHFERSFNICFINCARFDARQVNSTMHSGLSLWIFNCSVCQTKKTFNEFHKWSACSST